MHFTISELRLDGITGSCRSRRVKSKLRFVTMRPSLSVPSHSRPRSSNAAQLIIPGLTAALYAVHGLARFKTRPASSSVNISPCNVDAQILLVRSLKGIQTDEVSEVRGSTRHCASS